MMNGGTGMRDPHESHVRRGQGLPSPEPSAENPSVRSQPGIMIFSRRRRLLHMNRRALELTGQINQAETEAASAVRSAPVLELSDQIQAILDSRREASICELYELKRVMVDSGRKILVRGFGLTDRDSHEDSRIVFVLEEMGLR
jgi:hypothetical protein